MRIIELPPEILRRILRQFVPLSNSRLYDWKKSLWVLAVCRLWRALAKKDVYAHIYFETIADGVEVARNQRTYEWEPSADISTNAQYIQLNGRFEDVEYFHYMNDTVKYLVPPLLHMVHAFSPREDEFPSTENIGYGYRDISEVYNAESGGDEDELEEYFDYFDPEYDLDARFEGHMHMIGPIIASRLPNLIAVYIHTCSSKSVDIVFASLLGCFQNQLNWLSCSSQPLQRHPPRFAYLTFLQLYMLDSNISSIPSICPTFLRSVEIMTFNTGPDWRYFHFDKAWNGIVFASLKSLVLGQKTPPRAPYSEQSDSPISRPTQRLAQLGNVVPSFPKLLYLKIDHSPLAADELECLMSVSLRLLELYGSLADMLFSTQYSVKHLHGIMMRISPLNGQQYGDEFIADTNTLFKRLRGIGIVKVIFCDTFMKFDVTRAEWSGITHLMISTRVGLDKVFQLLESIPTLMHVTLCLWFSEFETLRFESMVVSSIEQATQQPYASKIKTAGLKYTYGIPAYYNNLVERMLWRFLPELQLVTRKQTPNEF